jgi:hypothetical protein
MLILLIKMTHFSRSFNEGGKDCWLKGTMQAGEVRWVKTATAGLALPP